MSSKDVHLWQADLSLPPEKVQQLWLVLSEHERCRAERFRLEKDQLSFIVARGILREILSQYLHLLPEQLTFSYTPQGKPFLML
ncbi:MAG: 4'-phosphopantetheinyl transferase family protein, partial [Microcoleaceae cyanobacterium]